MKATIKIVTAQKEFSQEDLDRFQRILNVLHSHQLSAKITFKRKVTETIKLQSA